MTSSPSHHPLFSRVAAGLILALCLFTSGQARGQNANVTRFAEIAKQVADMPPAEKPDARISEALEILVSETLKVYRARSNATEARWMPLSSRSRRWRTTAKRWQPVGHSQH